MSPTKPHAEIGKKLVIECTKIYTGLLKNHERGLNYFKIEDL